MKRRIFYSFHFKNDVLRVHQIRNIGAIEDNKPVSENDWEEVKEQGDDAVKEWIDENMQGRSCVVVLIGEKTAKRKWVRYEIRKAWNEGKALLGIYIHNIKCPNNGTCSKGENPFDQFTLEVDGEDRPLSSFVKCRNPKSGSAYKDIRDNLEDWIEEAIKNKKN